MDKYQVLHDAGTNGVNYGFDTDDVVAHLRGWDEKYGVSLDDVTHDAVVVSFDRLPSDLAPLVDDIYEFCPDVIDQHFGCMAEMAEMADETDEGLPAELQELLEGVDLEDEDYGKELLKRSLKKHKKVALWWD